MTREQKIEEAAIRLDNLLGALSLPVPDRIHVLALREALPEIRALLEPAALAAPVEPAVAVDVTEKEEDDAVYLLGHRAGAEWMREQAARAARSVQLNVASVEGALAMRDTTISAIRSLPTSPPAPEEAHTPQIPCSVHGLPLHVVYRCDKCPDGGAQKQDGGSA